jgi:hypothetical protein
MFKSLWPHGAFVVLALCAVGVHQAAEPELNPQEGVLVLRSGRVLRGGIIRVGDRYVVTLGDTDEVGVPADLVELRCDSLRQAYEIRKSALPIAAQASDHWKLADWCLQYGLLSAAAEQLMAVMNIEPDNPRIPQFEKRLKLALRRAREPAAHVAHATQEVSQTELDRIVRALPSGVVEQFTSAVQPLLLNRCSNGSCHGANTDSDFRLVRPSWSRTLPRRFTQRNLYESLNYVNPQQPASSELLVKSTSPHGGADAPVLDERDTESLQLLAAWVHRVSQGKPSIQPTAIRSSQDLLLQPNDAVADGTEPCPLPSHEARPTPEDAVEQPGELAPPSDSSAAANHAAGRDPFDPELFNQRFLKRRQQPASGN